MRKMERGASIIIHKWVRLKPWDRLLIVTSKEYEQEAKALRRQASSVTRSVSVLLVENKGMHVGMFFDDNEEIFDPYTTIIAATEYSLVTTKMAKRAIRRHKKFLSLPLSTNDGRSMLRYDFLMMDTKKKPHALQGHHEISEKLHRMPITTPAGTDLTVEKRGREPGFFNGVLKDSKDYSSASIEVYVPIEETRTNGVMVVDGSLGYIGGQRTRCGFGLRPGGLMRNRGQPNRKPTQGLHGPVSGPAHLYCGRAGHWPEFSFQMRGKLLY